MRIGIIGGSGVNPLGNIEAARRIEQQTAFGPVAVLLGNVAGMEAAFIQRHGGDRPVPPHRINHHANIAALRALGVERCLGICAVGSLRPDLPPGSLAVLSGFLDFCRSKVWTFYDSHPQGVVHTDFTEPYCPDLRQLLATALNASGSPASCVYVGVDGPRYETPSEIAMFSSLGGDVIGMTGVPEAVLGREAGICYAGIAVVANLAAGLTPTRIAHEEVLRAMDGAAGNLWTVIADVVRAVKSERDCACGRNWRLWEDKWERVES